MSLSPYLRTPFTDVTAGLVSHQLMGRCQREEMLYMECLEAYGLERGKPKCMKLHDNFRECHTMDKQIKRFLAMRRERDRQIAEGKLTGDDKYVNPKIDSY